MPSNIFMEVVLIRENKKATAIMIKIIQSLWNGVTGNSSPCFKCFKINSLSSEKICWFFSMKLNGNTKEEFASILVTKLSGSKNVMSAIEFL
jgi:hypothetical protein